MCSGTVCGMLFLGAVPQQSSLQKNGDKEYRMTYLEQAEQAIECGLLPAVRIEGRPQQPLKLCERMARYKVPGFGFALIEDGEIASSRGFGVLEVGGNDPVTGDTLFQAASISKPVTAIATLHLVETGLGPLLRWVLLQ